MEKEFMSLTETWYLNNSKTRHEQVSRSRAVLGKERPQTGINLIDMIFWTIKKPSSGTDFETSLSLFLVSAKCYVLAICP